MSPSQLQAQQLLDRLSRLRPDYGPAELMRMGLLLSLQFPDLRELGEDSELRRQCQELSLQLSAAGDQHAAVADELDSLAATAPCDFSPSHIWTLVKAIKVQSRILNLYLGPLEPSC